MAINDIQQTIVPIRSQQRVTLLRSFGWHAITALSIGTALILAGVAFLCFLWVGTPQNTVWHSIVLSGWVTRSITITALVLRTAVAAQAAICTSMIAAILLNDFQVPLHNAAPLSILRFSNTGPRSLLAYLPGGTAPKTLFISAIALCMTIATILLQFTSTALLSNIGIGLLPVSAITQNLAYGINTSAPFAMQLDGTQYIGNQPTEYAAFADYSEPASFVDGVSDTGVSMRAFLPLDQGVRASVTNYSGMATLLDSRVACMRPSVSNIEVSAILGEPTISGIVWTDYTVPRFNRTSPGITKTPFNCTWAMPGFFQYYYSGLHEWPLAMCLLSINDSGIISEMDPLIIPPLTSFNPGAAFLLINATGTVDEWGPINNAGGSLPVIEVFGVDAWTQLWTNNSDLSLALSLCYMNFEVQDTTVNAWRTSGNNTEPSLSWDNSTSTFNTLSVRKQLGATSQHLSTDQRKIFALDSKVSWQAPPFWNYTSTGATSNDRPTTPQVISTYASKNFITSDPVLLCGFCQPGGKIKTSRANSAMFNDILKDTGSPALAIQALYTTIFSQAYYGHLFQFQISAPAHTVYDVSVLQPTGWGFFAAVLVIVGVHLGLVLLVSLIFVFVGQEGRKSLLGNAWSAVAQVHGVEVEEWLERAGDMKDTELKRAVKASGLGTMMVGVEESSGQLQLGPRARMYS